MVFSLTSNKNDRDSGLVNGHSTRYNGAVTICVIKQGLDFLIDCIVQQLGFV